MASDRPKRKAIPATVKLASAYIACGVEAGRAAALARGGTAMKDRDRYWQISALLHVFGVDPHQPGGVEWDHDPPLALRAINAAGDDYDPPQLDPRHITPRGYVDHRAKTTGTPPGQKVVHVANGDQHKIAKAARLERARRADLAEGRFGYTTMRLDTKDGQGIVSEYQPVTAKAKRVAFPPGRKMQSRPFPKKAKPNG